MERFSTEGTTEVWYEVSDGQSLSDGVVRAVSAVTGLLPAVPLDSDIETDTVMDPLTTVIDPDALNKLFDPSPDETVASITFGYHGLSVTADSTGIVRVTPADRTAESLIRARVPTPENRLEEAGQ
jgi:hypothetical protein